MNWSLELPNFVQGIIHPKSFYLTEFSSGSVRALSTRISEAIDLGQGIFPIFIESMGGDMSSLKAMMSILASAKRKGLKISTITSGEAASAGAFIFCLGDDGLRFMGDHAHIMIHGIQVSSVPDGRASEQKELFNEIMKEEQELLQVVSSNLKGPRNKDWLKKELHKRKDIDWFLNAKEALDIGIAHYIGLPTFSLKLTSEISVVL